MAAPKIIISNGFSKRYANIKTNTKVIHAGKTVKLRNNINTENIRNILFIYALYIDKDYIYIDQEA